MSAAVPNRIVSALRPRAIKYGSFIVRWSEKFGKYTYIRIRRSWNVLKVEMAPPTLADMPEMAATAQKLLKSAFTYKFINLTFREMTINLIIVIDLILCFFLGEIIGKRSLVGYKLPPRYTRAVGTKELISG
ncbi:hypothetical protein LOTGIDRAFT_230848 [Lottia gigantea]|uniref:ATP synthase subunit n=1 Tax=Lottia gigantea TaxID=225164 RepID=V4ARN3_LOTGI|nr:hypothetical protein LOTGIDRAFT_230848 [Lottia gigantea]ESO99892.1 hypothetical protein LOTGIDRAFT_230848 [Lottia gigantea]